VLASADNFDTSYALPGLPVKVRVLAGDDTQGQVLVAARSSAR
jgi:hypothetical protein